MVENKSEKTRHNETSFVFLYIYIKFPFYDNKKNFYFYSNMKFFSVSLKSRRNQLFADYPKRQRTSFNASNEIFIDGVV